MLTKIHESGVYKLTPERLFLDPRGMFMEAHRVSELESVLHGLRFVQSNISRSGPFILRGMHWQVGKPCGKLIRCLQGKIYQVAVDVRPSSPTFGQSIGTVLNDVTNEAVYVPPMFANGFSTFEAGAVVHYEMTAYHDALAERAFRWDDPAVGIRWPFGRNAVVTMSPKDRNAPLLRDVA